MSSCVFAACAALSGWPKSLKVCPARWVSFGFEMLGGEGRGESFSSRDELAIGVASGASRSGDDECIYVRCLERGVKGTVECSVAGAAVAIAALLLVETDILVSELVIDWR